MAEVEADLQRLLDEWPHPTARTAWRLAAGPAVRRTRRPFRSVSVCAPHARSALPRAQRVHVSVGVDGALQCDAALPVFSLALDYLAEVRPRPPVPCARASCAPLHHSALQPCSCGRA